ncbi:hypothetical protein AVEN_239802-1 [Araneus ventricosus]|uniref:RNase H type-1 domain-containing protein n=1 Tax=Araneus ventricosus TaxID=182803 RepID=A0A4Y2ET45_ARAVE|nr:hypothetical protein AVEN_239802-1 [Araneus ventricosus]
MLKFLDSKSSIEALRRANIKSNFVLSVKEHLYKAKDLIGLVWVKAHAGNPGNELADHFAKIPSSCGTEMHIPLKKDPVMIFQFVNGIITGLTLHQVGGRKTFYHQ